MWWIARYESEGKHFMELTNKLQRVIHIKISVPFAIQSTIGNLLSLL